MRSIVILFIFIICNCYSQLSFADKASTKTNYQLVISELDTQIKNLAKNDPRRIKLENIKKRINKVTKNGTQPITDEHQKKLDIEIAAAIKPPVKSKDPAKKEVSGGKARNGNNRDGDATVAHVDTNQQSGSQTNGQAAGNTTLEVLETKQPISAGNTSSGSSQNHSDAPASSSDEKENKANLKIEECFGKKTEEVSTGGVAHKDYTSQQVYDCACIRFNLTETQRCKKLKKDAGIGKDDDDDNSCSGLLKAYNKSLEDKDEACGKGPNAGSCIQDYMDCTSGVLKNKDVYDNVNDKLTDAMKLQALFKSAGTQAGIPGKTLDKCNMLSGRDFFAKKDKLEEKKKDLERDLQEAKKDILENQKNNAIEAQELKDQIANLKTEFEEKKKSMSEEMRNMTKSMIDRSKDLESKKKETALTIQRKNIEIMNMLNGYNKQLAMVTMNGSSAANCKMEMMKQKEILDKQKLGGNVGNSIQKKNLLTTSFKTCMENLRKDLKLMQETFQKQKEIADTELINLNSTMSSYSEEIESSKRELEQFKNDHANELTTAEKSMMEKLMALAQRQQEQMQRTTQQNIDDQELIKNYEAELRATTLEIMAMGNEEPSNREGDKNWAAVEDKIASARNKANDYYKACCKEDGEHKNERSCKRLEDGDGSYRAIEKKGVKTVVPTNSTGTGKQSAQ